MTAATAWGTSCALAASAAAATAEVITAMVVQAKQGLVPSTIFRGERRWEMAGWMVGSQLFAVGAVFWTFMARPVWWNCSCQSMCSCTGYVKENQLWSMFCGVGEYECEGQTARAD